MTPKQMNVATIAAILGEPVVQCPEMWHDTDTSDWVRADWDKWNANLTPEQRQRKKQYMDEWNKASKKAWNQVLRWRKLYSHLKFKTHGQGNFRWKYYNSNPDNKNRGDCVVRAFGFFDGYWDFQQTLRKQGVGVSRGVSAMHYEPLAEKLGYTYLPIWGAFTKAFLPDVGSYVVHCHYANHLVAVKDGVVYDTWDSRRRRPRNLKDRMELVEGVYTKDPVGFILCLGESKPY